MPTDFAKYVVIFGQNTYSFEWTANIYIYSIYARPRNGFWPFWGHKGQLYARDRIVLVAFGTNGTKKEPREIYTKKQPSARD